VHTGIGVTQYLRRICDIHDANSLIENTVAYGAYQCRRNAVTSTVSKSKDYVIILPGKQVKIAADNIFWLIENKTVREALSYVKIIREETFLDMPGIIVASLNLANGQPDLFIK